MSLSRSNMAMLMLSILLLVANNEGQAHEASYSYLEVHYGLKSHYGLDSTNIDASKPNEVLYPQLTASWHLSLADLQQMVDMDVDQDQRILGWEVRAQLPFIQESLNGVLILPLAADCQWSLSDFKVRPSVQKTDVTMEMIAICEKAIDTLQISVSQDFSGPLLYQFHHKQMDESPIDKGVVEPGQHSRIIVVEADLHGHDLGESGLGESDLRESGQFQASHNQITNVSFFYFVLEGIKHILIGADHLVFLLLLLFSAVWRKGELVVFNLPALQKLFAYTGCFTIAHSITLALGWWQLTPIPMKWIEVLIALTIVWSAVAVLKQRKPLGFSIVFIFGLIHGFGFASVLLDSPAADYYGTSTLIGFNVGVELGQFLFLCVSALLMRAFSIKQTDYFARLGTFSALAVAGIWVLERSTGLMLIS